MSLHTAKSQATIRKKRLIKFSVVAALLVVLIAGAYILYRTSADTSNQLDTDSSKGADASKESNRPSKNDDTDSSGALSDSSNPAADPSNANPPTNPTETGHYKTITPPPITPPANNAPYPIENSRYRIDQTTSRSFTVTLYPIEGPDYDLQLRNYKQDALNYLESRHGNTNNLSITWRPEAAAKI